MLHVKTVATALIFALLFSGCWGWGNVKHRASAEQPQLLVSDTSRLS